MIVQLPRLRNKYSDVGYLGISIFVPGLFCQRMRAAFFAKKHPSHVDG